MSRRSWLKAFIFTASFAIGIALLWFLVEKAGWEMIRAEVWRFGFWPLVGFVALSFVNFTLYSWRWQIITNSHIPAKNRQPLLRMYWHRLSGYAFGYLTPAAQVAGEPVRIALLVGSGVSAKAATSSVTLDIGFELCAYVFFIIAGVAFALAEGAGDPIALSFTIVGLGILLLLILGFLFSAASGKRVLSGLMRRVGFTGKRTKHVTEWVSEMEGLMTEFFKGRRLLVFGIACLSLVMSSFRIVEVFYLATFFGVSLNLGQAFLTSTLPGIALLFPVPGGLGVFEGSFSALFTALGIPINPVAFTLMIRARDAVFISLGVMHLVHSGGKYVVKKTLDTQAP